MLGLIRNSYGNYVIQRSLKVSSGKDLEQLLQAITNKLPEILDKKIRSKWEQIIRDANNGIFPNHDDHNESGSQH